MASSAGRARSEWFVGAEHEELLEITRQHRRQRTQSSKSANTASPHGDKHDAKSDKPSSSKLPVHEAAERVRIMLEDNFDGLYDAYTELDSAKNGRLTRIDFRNGLLRCLGSSAQQLPDAAIEGLFDAIDIDKQGFISLKQFLVAFQAPDYSKSRGSHDAGEARSLARKAGKLAVAEDREARVNRDFQEVRRLRACPFCFFSWSMRISHAFFIS
jgi:hypothetical protein